MEAILLKQDAFLQRNCLEELQRREDAFQLLRKLNTVGAPATTEREDSREAESTV